MAALFDDAVVRPLAYTQWLVHRRHDAVADWEAAIAELHHNQHALVVAEAAAAEAAAAEAESAAAAAAVAEAATEAAAREARLLAIAQTETTPTTMRFYEDKRPDIGDTVMGEIMSVTEYGVFVRLIEYDGLEGYAQLNHMKRGRVRSANQVGHAGQIECFEVSAIAEHQIELSKIAVSAAAKEACLAAYHAAKKVHDVMQRLAKDHARPNINAELGWPGVADLERMLGDGERGFEKLLGDDVPKLCIELRREVTLRIVNNEPTQVRRYAEVMCFEYAGINAVKQALRCGLAIDPIVKITLVNTPMYCVEVEHANAQTAQQLAQRAMDAIEADIVASGGRFKERLTRERLADDDYGVMLGGDRPDA